MSGHHEITLYLKPKQVKSLEKRKTFQLTHADLISKSGEPITLKVSKKLHTKFNNVIRNSKGIRIMAEFHHEGGGIFDVVKNIGRKVINVVPKVAKKVINVVPKPLAKAGISALATMSGNPELIPIANMATDAVYATQGKGLEGEPIIPSKYHRLNRVYTPPSIHNGQGILDLLFGGSIKADTKHGKGILDLLFGSGFNPHHGRGLLDLLFGGSYKEGKGIFDVIKKVAKVIPKEVVQGIANKAIEKVVPPQLQGIAKAGTNLGLDTGYKSLGSGLKKLKLIRGSGSNADSNIEFLKTRGDLINGVQLQNNIKKIRRGGSFLPL